MVIDDDPGVRDSLGKLLRSAGFRVSLLGSVSEFLEADRPEGPACLVLDVRLPGQSGLELQRELAGAKDSCRSSSLPDMVTFQCRCRR